MILRCIDGPDVGYQLEAERVSILETSGRGTVTTTGPGGYHPDASPVRYEDDPPAKAIGRFQNQRPRVYYGWWRTIGDVIEYRWILTTWTRKNWTLSRLWGERNATPFLEHSPEISDEHIAELLSGRAMV